MFLRHAWDDRSKLSQPQPLLTQLRDLLQRRVGRYKLLRDHETPSSSTLSASIGSLFSSKSRDTSRTRGDADGAAGTELLLGGNRREDSMDVSAGKAEDEGLTLYDTVKLSLEFCLLWFSANYFAAACLEYTTVASSTILASTSSIWTLLCGSVLRVERFTLRKFLGVVASLLGVVIISSVDVSGDTDENRGSFPHKTTRELAIGDAMAFVSAVLYGFYAVYMKKRIGDESKVNMPLFFGLVGLFNVLLLWPGIIILSLTGIEPFQLPPTRKIFTIVMVNSASSLVSDFCWAYSMLLTSPLIITVGLSLTIPLSLIGQMVLDGQYMSWLYWVGAAVMVLSFLFVNHEEERDESEGLQGEGADYDTAFSIGGSSRRTSVAAGSRRQSTVSRRGSMGRGVV